MTQRDAKKLIAYLESLSETFTREEQFKEMAKHIAVLEAEIERR